MDNMLALALEHREKGEWQDYVNTMLVRNDWLEENGKPRETELYLISQGMEYGYFDIVGVYEGVIGLNIKEIQKQFYEKMVKEVGYNSIRSLQRYVDLYGGSVRNEGMIFVGYLIKDLGLKKIDIKETNLEDTSLDVIASKQKKEKEKEKDPNIEIIPGVGQTRRYFGKRDDYEL